MMERSQLLQVVQDLVTDEVVVPVMSAIKGWARIPEHFFWCTAMGYGSSVAVGLALAQPERKVIVLDGDGSLLMNLGSLVTIAGLQPRNLIHIVLENGLYELPGSIPVPGRGVFSLPEMARAAGLKKIREYDEIRAFERGLLSMLKEEGPFFAVAQVAPSAGDELPKMTLVDMSRKLERALSPD